MLRAHVSSLFLDLHDVLFQYFFGGTVGGSSKSCSPERAVKDNVSPCFSGCSRPEHSTVRCRGVSRHEQGSSRLDDLSLCTEYSRTAGDTASSSSLTSPRLFEVFLVIALRLHIRWALSLVLVVEWILFRLPSCSSGQSGCVRARLHLFNDLALVRRCDVKAYPADPRSKTIKLSDAAVRRSLRSVRDSVV